ncbi:hypothetical protein [Halocatena pleomorpha]|uniref:hypothetical protein n=1 Tax=Halocatena pleomorpha TaxID=1785090 RepID=UPI001639973F|nr:hypothetical protein [Halocatena pleomorpha]
MIDTDEKAREHHGHPTGGLPRGPVRDTIHFPSEATATASPEAVTADVNTLGSWLSSV